MPFPQNMAYVRWDFNWRDSSEIQSFGIWGVVSNEGAPVFADWQPLVEAIALQGVEAWIANFPKTDFSRGVQGNRVVCYHYRQDHKEVLHRAEAGFSGDNAWQSTTGASLPPQNALVASLYAYDPAGYAPQRARKRGRIYLPTPAQGVVDGSGQMTLGGAGGWAGYVKDFLNDMTAELGTLGGGALNDMRWRPYVSSVAGEMATQVSHVRVGTVVDTQRRRRAQLVEGYADLAL